MVWPVALVWFGASQGAGLVRRKGLVWCGLSQGGWSGAACHVGVARFVAAAWRGKVRRKGLGWCVTWDWYGLSH